MQTKTFLASVVLAIVMVSCSHNKNTLITGQNENGQVIKVNTVKDNYRIQEMIEVDSVRSETGTTEYYAIEGPSANPYTPGARLNNGYTFLGRGMITIINITNL